MQLADPVNAGGIGGGLQVDHGGQSCSEAVNAGV